MNVISLYCILIIIMIIIMWCTWLIIDGWYCKTNSFIRKLSCLEDHHSLLLCEYWWCFANFFLFLFFSLLSLSHNIIKADRQDETVFVAVEFIGKNMEEKLDTKPHFYFTAKHSLGWFWKNKLFFKQVWVMFVGPHV